MASEDENGLLLEDTDLFSEGISRQKQKTSKTSSSITRKKASTSLIC